LIPPSLTGRSAAAAPRRNDRAWPQTRCALDGRNNCRRIERRAAVVAGNARRIADPSAFGRQLGVRVFIRSAQ